MAPPRTNWSTVAESRFPWEREALEFVRERFPAHEPYRAWTNFEFLADDGSLNEVDLLAFTPQGLFLVEIKSRPGRLSGDAGTWTWVTEGRVSTTDNPLFAANLKAKKLRSLLERQKAFRKKGRVPFVEPLVFCSAAELRLELQGNARFRVCLRDRETADGEPRPGVMAALRRRDCPGLERNPKGVHDGPTGRLVAQALEQAGVRPSQRQRRVGDYLLEGIIGEGPGYQDWHATHAILPELRRRVRLYLVRAGVTAEEREMIERAARREAQLLEALAHPGILRTYGFTEHELGPALFLEHDPRSVRLDHFLAQRKDSLDVGTRLDLVRQVAEAVRYAHEKKAVHRALCPQSVLVWEADSPRPRVKLFNWQVGFRGATTSSGPSRAVTATSHVDRLVEDASTAYMAPEALHDDNPGEHLDVFSLGAVAYHVFSGVPPAANGLELGERLRESKGLQISAVLNGAGESLQDLVRYATHPEVGSRLDAAGFLEYLDAVEEELTEPDDQYKGDPARAHGGDLLPGGYRVVRRLGQGGCAVAYLVEHGDEEFVLKLANDPDQSPRLRDEADVLGRLHQHANVVAFPGPVEIGGRAGFLSQPVYVDKERRTIETLGDRRRREGRLGPEFLERFGEDLLGAVHHLEELGIPHRDIKPENIAVGKMGRGDKLRLVLFDFSLSRVPPENVRAGTAGYLDPFLPLRKPPRWDLHAERYAAAATLYELATGTLPRFGDGSTAPDHLGCEATVDAELFDPGLRDRLGPFFAKALRRNPAERFDNAEEMLRAWRECFADSPGDAMAPPGGAAEGASAAGLGERLARATFDTSIAELGLGTRATNALDRANVLTVADLLTVPARRLLRLRGVGTKTRSEISAAIDVLRGRLGRPARDPASVAEEAAAAQTDAGAEPGDAAALSVDLLAQRVLKTGSREAETVRKTLRTLLGLDPSVGDRWPNQAQAAAAVGVTRARVGQILGKAQSRWAKDAGLTKFRDTLDELVAAHGGAAGAAELAEAVLAARGSVLDEPERSRLAGAVLRAALEVERTVMEPRFLVRRDGGRILVASGPELAAFALRLGDEADLLAAEDPLVPAVRALERLRAVPAPEDVSLSDSRVVRLAAAASAAAAVSSRGEFYPRGLAGERALKLSIGALAGLPKLTTAEIRDRVASRYPEAAPLPDRPELDDLLLAAGLDLSYDFDLRTGAGTYVPRTRSLVSVTSGTPSVERLPTASGQPIAVPSAAELTPEEADARRFEERLKRAVKDGAFMALLADPREYQRAAGEISRRFPVRLVDFEGLFLDALREAAEKARVNWETVVRADASRGQGDWKKLLLLVDRALPAMEGRLVGDEKTLLVVYAGLLARYDKMDLLNRLRDRIGRAGGIGGLWLLVPGDGHALIDGRAVPLIGPGERAKVPKSWLENVHRANGNGKASA